MKPVKTHTFKLGKYIIWDMHISGFCDEPKDDGKMYMLIEPGNSREALATAIHEAMHAQGIPAKYVDGEEDLSENIARFLWRLGWRREESK